jgi:hypothetical protein
VEVEPKEKGKKNMECSRETVKRKINLEDYVCQKKSDKLIEQRSIDPNKKKVSTSEKIAKKRKEKVFGEIKTKNVADKKPKRLVKNEVDLKLKFNDEKEKSYNELIQTGFEANKKI